MATATEVVLLIPELLGAILLYLDMTTLLVSGLRVSRAWNNLITNSQTIQEALFFRAAKPIKSAHIPRPDHNTETTLNPLLVKKFGPCFFDFGKTYGHFRRASSFYELPWTPQSGPELRLRIASASRPSLWKSSNDLEHLNEDIRINSPEADKMDVLKFQDEEEARKRFTRSDASWRKMLVSQPPPSQLGYVWVDKDWAGHRLESATALVSPNTKAPFLRMGQLYDIVQYHAGHHDDDESLYFRVTWGQPQEIFVANPHKETYEKLVARSTVVVEFLRTSLLNVATFFPAPADLEAFEASFRCAEYRPVDVQASKIVGDTNLYRVFDNLLFIL